MVIEQGACRLKKGGCDEQCSAGSVDRAGMRVHRVWSARHDMGTLRTRRAQVRVGLAGLPGDSDLRVRQPPIDESHLLFVEDEVESSSKACAAEEDLCRHQTRFLLNWYQGLTNNKTTRRIIAFILYIGAI